MSNYVKQGKLQVADVLYDFIMKEALSGTGLDAGQFWSGLEELIHDMTPENKALLVSRDQLQAQIDEWHRQQGGAGETEDYKAFLQEIGYLEPRKDAFQITTSGVDEEITRQAGPQLVVPVNNPRYALNAANARWGSLYDALYGTDVLPETDGATCTPEYNPVRGAAVIAYAKQFLDETVPLQEGSHAGVTQYHVQAGELTATLADGTVTRLQDLEAFAGYQGDPGQPEAVLLRQHGLHLELQIDRKDRIGSSDEAGVKDIIMEAALTTIMDCEDSVAAVDAEDKVGVYRAWLGLMRGDLSVSFTKAGSLVHRSLNGDRTYTSPEGEELQLSGRSLLFVRNVGHLMTNEAILDEDGQEVFEGLMDAVVTSLIALHDLQGRSRYRNSAQGSVYIVKPKMHGSAEAAFSNRLFNRVEDLLGLPRHTLKIGLMDEERRTSLNLDACIYELRERIAFINTGFLDRTGDEIHTSMEAGTMIKKLDMKSAAWLQAYEQNNVHTGLAAGFRGHAQIGKGMWAMPDLMADMIVQKVGQLKAGANTAWVPSPTAAVLHAMHYHQVHVDEIQQRMSGIAHDYRNEILQIPQVEHPSWTDEELAHELDNNAQSILGYVVRWVDQGIGCSKVPDLHNVGLMEDRATLRISSQHIANWLRHGLFAREQVRDALIRMAAVVDGQNAGDSAYRPMTPDVESSIAFQAACDLVFLGCDQPNGYTEPILHRRRLEAKRTQRQEHSRV
ncbi:malate synthase G [Paenibacillus daejeonensis]|uniref:malate synthase G n=1 Tax=Paenibacillus daejeonensis TaxID=135193 RepID=UPI000373CE0E|nr:malate synthase G [Paenibacillus daejeonensis]